MDNYFGTWHYEKYCRQQTQGIFGYARMKDLGCAMDSQGIEVMCEWKIEDAQ